MRSSLVPGHGGRVASHRAGKPQQKGFAESFNGRLRDERLIQHRFFSLAAARRIIEAQWTDYNTVRPHSSLGGMAPDAFTNRPRQGREDTKAKLSAAGNGAHVRRQWLYRGSSI